MGICTTKHNEYEQVKQNENDIKSQNEEEKNEYDQVKQNEDDNKISPSCNSKKGEYINCISIKRLLNSLKKYQNIGDEFINFVIDNYKTVIINDYQHLLQDHGDDIFEIYEYFVNEQGAKNCVAAHCEFASRHHRTDKNKKNVSLQTINMVFMEIMDSLHVHIYHLYQYGLRTPKGSDGDGGDNIDDEEKKGDNKYFDAEFNKLTQMIRQRRKVTASFGRFKVNAAKFNITVNAEEFGGDILDNKHGSTYLDVIYDGLSSNNIDIDGIKQFYQFIEDQQYETDSVVMDIDINFFFFLKWV